MNPKIRKSIVEDAEHFVAIKQQLSLNYDGKKSTDGGFILGTDINTYRYYIEEGYCYTALHNNKIVGYGIVLPNELVRQSELWQKRASVQWDINFRAIESANICYFEQLAFLKGYKKLSLLLAFGLTKSVFETKAEYILTTTVQQPILNLAAIPYIKAVGGKLIGNIDEEYPDYGRIVSDIYLMSRTDFFTQTSNLSYIDFLNSMPIQKGL